MNQRFPASKPVANQLRFRPDIVWEAQADGHTWIAQDPVRGAFFSFSELEYAAARLVESSTSTPEILDRLRRRFPGAQLTAAWLLSLVKRFQQFHLLQPVSDMQLRQLIDSKSEQTGQQVLRQLLSPLAIRIPLGDPSRWLARLKPIADLLFHRWTVLSALVLAVFCFLAVARSLLANPSNLANELHSITGYRIAVALMCFAVCKCIHELGHMFACVTYGARCKEIGFLLLCFTPCMYCDTTDSWKLPSRWQRAAIAAAGMYFELIIASLAALVWLCTTDGSLHYLAGSTMVVCSVSTLLINSNPLLKYDGYYILADVWNISNLQEQSRTAANLIFQSLFTQARAEDQRAILTGVDGSPSLLASYWLASLAYRTLVLTVILGLVWLTLVPLGFGMLAIALSAALGLGLLLSCISWSRSLAFQLQNRSWRYFRLCLTGAALSALLWFLLTYPIPVRTAVLAVTAPGQRSPVFASHKAVMVACISSGTSVQAGEQLVRLESYELDVDIAQLKGETDLLQVQIDSAKELQTNDETSAYRLPSLQEQLSDRKQRLELLREEQAKLDILAHAPGMWLPSESKASPTLTAFRDDRKAALKCSPGQIGRVTDEGELLGWLIESNERVINALVHEDAVRRLQVGMPAEIRWDSQAHVSYTMKIESISREPIERTPHEVIGDPRFISVRDSDGKPAPDSPHYEVRLVVDDPEAAFGLASFVPPSGSLASARFETHRATVLEIVREYVEQNLRPIY